ncbi:MAG: HNH endonuclease [Thermoplasmata archaeon]
MKLAWCNYGVHGAKAPWEVDHSVPLSRGGTDHMNNVFPACIPCNQAKGDMTGAEFLRLFEEPSPRPISPWEGLIGLALGVLATGALIGALRGSRSSK